MTLLPVIRADKSKEFYLVMCTFVGDVHTCVSHLNTAVKNYCDGKAVVYRKSANLVIDFEAKADQSRRKLEKMLYAGVVLPFGRGAKYELLESMDDVADKAEIVARLLLIEKVKIPKRLRTNFKELADNINEAATHLQNAVLHLDIDLDKAVSHAAKVEHAREQVRKLEFKLIEKLFSTLGKDLSVILLKELVTLIGQVADKSEQAADRIISLAVKYQG